MKTLTGAELTDWILNFLKEHSGTFLAADIQVALYRADYIVHLWEIEEILQSLSGGAVVQTWVGRQLRYKYTGPSQTEPSLLVSPKCERVIEDLDGGKIPCWSFSSTRRAAACLAWQEMEDKKQAWGQSLKESWTKVKEKCTWAGR